MKTKPLLVTAVALVLFATPSFALDAKVNTGVSTTIQKQEDMHATERTESYEMSEEENAKADTQVYFNPRMSAQDRREQEQKLARRHINEHHPELKKEAAANDDPAPAVEVKTKVKARNTFNN